MGERGILRVENMPRWRIQSLGSAIVPAPGACVPHVLVEANGVVIQRYACEEGDRRLCPCLFDALLAARVYTWSTSCVCSVVREWDRLLIGRTGPKKGKAE